jgi:prepilin-type N-terminal cleavage/methylation domain-containing protein
MQKPNKHQDKDKGFTLIEMLVVMSVISLLSSSMFATIHRASEKTQSVKIAEDAHVIYTQFDLIRTEKNKTIPGITIPLTGATCDACNFNPTQPMKNQSGAIGANNQDWRGLGFPNGAPLDPWGSPYTMDQNESEGGTYPPCRHDVVYSAGPNGILENFGGTFGGPNNSLQPGFVYRSYVDNYYFTVPFYFCVGL